MVVGRILAYLLSAAFVESAVTDRQGGNRYFDFNEQTVPLPGMSPEFNFARQQPASDDQTFGRRLTSGESLRLRTPQETFTMTRPSQGKDTFGIRRQSLELLRRDNNFRNSITPSDSPRKQERTNFLSGEKSSSREISPKFHSVPNNRQQGRLTYETISQERTTQRSDETFLTDRDPHEVPVRPTYRQFTATNPPVSQERTSSRSELASFLEDEDKSSNLRSGSRERSIIRPTSSQESSTIRSEESFLTDKDPPEVPVRQTFRQLAPNEPPMSRERATSRSELTFLTDREESQNSRPKLNFRGRLLSTNRPLPAVTAGEDRSFRRNEDSFLTDNERTNAPERQNATRNASPIEQEQSPARTEATFLTDEEDYIYFPDGKDSFFPRPPTRQKEEEQNKPSRSEEAFLTEKENFSNVFPKPNRKVSSSNNDRRSDENSSPRSEETFLTDDDDLGRFFNRPNNRNQKEEDTSQKPEDRPDELFLSEGGPLPPKNGRYRVISTVAPSSQENDVEDNFLIDNGPNPLPAPAREDTTAPPKHLGRVRWPPPKNLEESAEANEKSIPSLAPLFYEDTMGIKPPAIRHSLEKEGNEGTDRNREKVDKIHTDSGENENESEDGDPPSREEHEGVPESEENEEGHPHTSNENNENHGSSQPNHESEADSSRGETNEPEEDFDPLSDDFEENHEEENQDLDAFPPLDNHEEHDSEEPPPDGLNQEESPLEHTEDSAESPRDHTEDSAESPPEHTEDSAESPPEHTEDSAESPPEHTEDSGESPPEHTEDSGESPPEHTEDSAESPPEHTEDSAESLPEENHSSSEGNHGSEESFPDDANGSEETPPEDSQEYPPDNTNNSDELPPEENRDSGETFPEVNPDSVEHTPEENQDQEDPTHEAVDSDNSIPNNEIESEETPPEQNNFSLEELFPTESEEQEKSKEQVDKPESNFSSRFPNKKLKPQEANGNPHFGTEETPSTESSENGHLEGDGPSETEYEDDSPKSSEENHDPDYPDGPKRHPNYEDNRLRPSGSFGEDPNKDSHEQNFSPEFNLDSFEFDLDVLEAPPSSELGSPTSPKPTPPARPTSLPADCVEGDEEGSTALPFDFKKAKKPIKTVKPERRPGDEVSITVSGPTMRVRTTKRTTTTTTPRPVTISALGVVKPGGEIIAKVVKPTMTTAGPQANPAQVESPSKKATTTKTTPWKAVLAAREATALTYLKPPPMGQPQTWFMTAPPPSPMFRLFVV